MSTQSTALFLGATLTIMLVPGPSALFAFTRSLEGGLRAGCALSPAWRPAWRCTCV